VACHADEWRGEPAEALAKAGYLAMVSSAILFRMPRGSPRGGFTLETKGKQGKAPREQNAPLKGTGSEPYSEFLRADRQELSGCRSAQRGWIERIMS
jgi:hypothetical protein